MVAADDVMVSVVCSVYNHEKYIESALKSFLNQICNFKFEILVHDDASTDKSAEIIKKFSLDYPDIVKPIFQNENKYSHGISISNVYQFPRAKGKYIAICEGDDCWCDRYKLQKQVDLLELHENVNICCHAAYIKENGEIKGVISPAREITVLQIGKVIQGGGGYVATSSIVFRSKIIQRKPLFYDKYPFDYSLQIFGSLGGGMLFLPDVMSVYNHFTEHSWSRNNIFNKNSSVLWQKKVIHMLVCFKHSYPMYEGEVNRVIQECITNLLIANGKYYSVLFNYDRFMHASLKQKIKSILGAIVGMKGVEIIKKLRYSNY